ncbi:hypothetical protein GCM10010383_73400 [Streptomyces lomondensis]|uniref:Uncharacterized protein n=1 Tax=Streptomyces lomondensis TaxID=68229 RepID=A0ABQ2XSR9_9ACTN|nr:hypothetical protein GCM10010383_73400 [Streptomyces lomondensis]
MRILRWWRPNSYESDWPAPDGKHSGRAHLAAAEYVAVLSVNDRRAGRPGRAVGASRMSTAAGRRGGRFQSRR